MQALTNSALHNTHHEQDKHTPNSPTRSPWLQEGLGCPALAAGFVKVGEGVGGTGVDGGCPGFDGAKAGYLTASSCAAFALLTV